MELDSISPSLLPYQSPQSDPIVVVAAPIAVDRILDSFDYRNRHLFVRDERDIEEYDEEGAEQIAVEIGIRFTIDVIAGRWPLAVIPCFEAALRNGHFERLAEACGDFWW
jgi:hypothetical protein